MGAGFSGLLTLTLSKSGPAELDQPTQNTVQTDAQSPCSTPSSVSLPRWSLFPPLAALTRRRKRHCHRHRLCVRLA